MAYIASGNILWFWWVKFFGNSTRSLSYYVWIISSTEHFSFSFPSYFFIYQLDSSVFWPVWVLCSLESSVTFHLFSQFLCFVPFRLWMLVTVNKDTFSLCKTVITFCNTPALGHIYMSKLKPVWDPKLLWKFVAIVIWHITFLQCVRIEPHSSGITNVENSTSSFCQTV